MKGCAHLSTAETVLEWGGVNRNGNNGKTEKTNPLSSL